MNIENTVFKDRYLTCCDCGEQFTFEAGEQRFYIKNKLSAPKRCPACRLIRKMDYSPEATKGVNNGQ